MTLAAGEPRGSPSFRGLEVSGGAPPVAALVRRSNNVIRARVLRDLRVAGYADLLPSQLTVFTWPGPDGQQPGALAEHCGRSKQAMNQLLGQLEASGYLVREKDPADRRRRVVRLTERGSAARAVMTDAAAAVEDQWRALVGHDEIDRLHRALLALADHFTDRPMAS